jgi:hypothetical protein
MVAFAYGGKFVGAWIVVLAGACAVTVVGILSVYIGAAMRLRAQWRCCAFSSTAGDHGNDKLCAVRANTAAVRHRSEEDGLRLGRGIHDIHMMQGTSAPSDATTA